MVKKDGNVSASSKSFCFQIKSNLVLGCKNYRASAQDIVDHIESMKGEKVEKEDDEEAEPAEQAEPEEIAPVGFCQDLMKDINLLSWAGIGFG